MKAEAKRGGKNIFRGLMSIVLLLEEEFQGFLAGKREESIIF
jgi:hypothetical protein